MTAAAKTVPLIAFGAGAQHFVLDVMRVRELVRAMPLVPAPGAPPWLLGHMVLRGEVLPVLSLQLALTLGLGAAPQAPVAPVASAASARGPAPQASQILVLDTGGHSFGLLVDRVQEVLRLPASALRPDLAPEGLRSPISFGLCDIRGQPHMLLDVRPLLALTDGGQGILEKPHD